MQTDMNMRNSDLEKARPAPRTNASRVDLPSALLSVALLAALVFLWLGYKQARANVAMNNSLKQALSDTLPKVGDNLSPLLSVRTVGGVDVDLVKRGQSSLWVLFSVHGQICMAESGSWPELAKSLSDKGASVYFLSLDGPKELADFGHSHPQLQVAAVSTNLLRSLRLTATPYYLVMSPTGGVQWAHRGAMSRQDAAEIHKRAWTER